MMIIYKIKRNGEVMSIKSLKCNEIKLFLPRNENEKNFLEECVNKEDYLKYVDVKDYSGFYIVEFKNIKIGIFDPNIEEYNGHKLSKPRIYIDKKCSIGCVSALFEILNILVNIMEVDFIIIACFRNNIRMRLIMKKLKFIFNGIYKLNREENEYDIFYYSITTKNMNLEFGKLYEKYRGLFNNNYNY